MTLGGFDESLYCAEDSEFIMRLKRYGKRKGKKFKIITDNYDITSTRTFDKFGDWYYFRYIPRILFRGGTKAFKDLDIVKRFWYDVRK